MSKSRRLPSANHRPAKSVEKRKGARSYPTNLSRTYLGSCWQFWTVLLLFSPLSFSFLSVCATDNFLLRFRSRSCVNLCAPGYPRSLSLPTSVFFNSFFSLFARTEVSTSVKRNGKRDRTLLDVPWLRVYMHACKMIYEGWQSKNYISCKNNRNVVGPSNLILRQVIVKRTKLCINNYT